MATAPRVIRIIATDSDSDATPPLDTQSLYASAEKIYPRSVTGRFTALRWSSIVLTQIVFYGLPWLQWNGRQAVLFNLPDQQFFLFGLVLGPYDLIYLAALLVISALLLFFVTAIAGRVWCGYACPQTVYTELFLWIERRIEGNRPARIKLDQARWTPRKLRIKATKHVLWLTLAGLTGFTFVGYFAPIRTLGQELLSLNLGPWQTFWIVFYSFATWGNAGFMREQVCKYMCPYARFQGAMFDRDTLIITYDQERGEPRGALRRAHVTESRPAGDCIDCGLCVQVCPTGIDIRQGLQYECIGCAACIDVCDSVMDKLNAPRGLVRYSTQRAIERPSHERPMQSAPLWRAMLRPRVVIYGALLGGLTLAFLGSLALRNPLRVDVLRDRNTLARLTPEGVIENSYRLHLTNASERPLDVEVSIAGLDGIARIGSGPISIQATSSRSVPVTVQLPIAASSPGVKGIEFVVRSTQNSIPIRREPSTFIVP